MLLGDDEPPKSAPAMQTQPTRQDSMLVDAPKRGFSQDSNPVFPATVTPDRAVASQHDEIPYLAQMTPRTLSYSPSAALPTPSEVIPAQPLVKDVPGESLRDGAASKSPRKCTASKSPRKCTASKSPSKGTPSKTPSKGTPSKTPSKGTPSKTPSKGTPSKRPLAVTPKSKRLGKGKGSTGRAASSRASTGSKNSDRSSATQEMYADGSYWK